MKFLKFFEKSLAALMKTAYRLHLVKQNIRITQLIAAKIAGGKEKEHKQ